MALPPSKYIWRDDQIAIRPYLNSDAPLLYEAARESISEVSPWLPWCHQDYSMEESIGWVESRANAWDRNIEYSFVIMRNSDEVFLGGCGINHINRLHNFANLGYWIRSSAAGQGVATRATRLTADFGFRQAGFQRLEILASVDNIASQRVAEKAGALREGMLRRRLNIRGIMQDAILFSMIPTTPAEL